MGEEGSEMLVRVEEAKEKLCEVRVEVMLEVLRLEVNLEVMVEERF